MPQSGLEKVESVFKIIAVILAGIWTIYVFRYQNVVLPSTEPVDAIIKAEFKKMGRINSMNYVLITFSIKNPGKIIEKFPISYYNLSGKKITRLSNMNDYANDTISIKNDSLMKEFQRYNL